jgi:predicted RND superfamily exporter protein
MERNPLAEESPLARPLQWLTEQSLRAPGMVVGGALLVALLAVLITLNGLRFKTSRLDLLNPKSAYNQRWLAHIAEFDEREDAVIVVRADDPVVVATTLEDLAAKLREQDQHFESIFYKRQLDGIKAKGLHFLSERQLREFEREVSRASGGVELAGYETRDRRVRTGDSGQELQQLARLKDLEPHYLTSDEGRQGYLLLRFRNVADEFARGGKAVSELRKTIAAARTAQPTAWIGLTGMPVIEYDEMQASQADMLWTNAISLLGVVLLFVAGYGGLRHALLACGVLLLGMAWSFGFLTLVVGHLNILSAAFAVILIGLGIDFGIHYVSSYLRLRKLGHDCRHSLITTAADVGPGVVTGGVTTAAAFFMAALTEFTGVRELGIIAGGGILMCVAAAVIVLPPLILISDEKRSVTDLPEILPAARWFQLSLQKPRLVMALGLAVTGLIAGGLQHLSYDHNLLNLQPRHVESVDIERDIFTSSDESVWFAVTSCKSRRELLARKAKLEKLPEVAKTEEIVSLLPESTPAKQRSIAIIHDKLTQLKRGREALASNPLLSLLAYSDPSPPTLQDIPRELTDRFVGKTGKHLLRVYAKGNIWDMDKLSRFVADVESVDPNITGSPVQTYYASRHMQQSYLLAGVYALLAVFGLLLIDFGTIRHSLLAMIPLALGFVQMCGLLGWLGIPFNPANLIALPLILGIGVDDGVHLVHEFRRQRGRFRLTDSTAVAVILTSTTTMASFGSMILARHQGLRTLGQVLSLGVFLCLTSSIVFFPALLSWLTRNRDEVAEEEASSAELDASPASSNNEMAAAA